MRYHNTVSVDPLVFTNFKRFMEKKDRDADIFDQVLSAVAWRDFCAVLNVMPCSCRRPS